ncbi:oligosaccharyl transferase subunit ost3/OST6 [Sorochytrium milnesiophthora]
MRLTSALVACVLALALCLAAVADAYTLAYKHKKLQSIRTIGSVLQLNSETYNVVTEAPRDYGIIVVLTAMSPQVGCTVCQAFEPEFTAVASSFAALKSDYPLYFGSLDFAVGREVYAKYQLNSAPNVYYFPATEGPHAKAIDTEFINYEISRRGISADDLAAWLGKDIGRDIPVKRPIDYTKVIIGVGALLFVAATARLVFTAVMALVSSRKLWAMISLSIILLMNCGFMWNRIRNPPFMADNKGRIEYISEGFQQQLGIETQITSTLYAICAFCVVALTTAVPKLETGSKQRLAIVVLLSIMVVTYSVLLRLFRYKNSGYPFKLLF